MKSTNSNKHITLNNILKPTFCKKCAGKYIYRALGEYECPKCGFIELDEYGVIRKYLEGKGAQPAVTISMDTGIPVPVIDQYLKQGRLEVPEGSEIYIKCERCNNDIRYGRFCPSCAANLSKEFSSMLTPNEIGETPKKNTGKMRFLDKEDGKDSKGHRKSRR